MFCFKQASFHSPGDTDCNLRYVNCRLGETETCSTVEQGTFLATVIKRNKLITFIFPKERSSKFMYIYPTAAAWVRG
jgi:hypothetical protein